MQKNEILLQIGNRDVPSFRFLKEPNKAVVHLARCHLMLVRHLPTSLMCSNTFVSRNKVVIHNCLILHFYPMPFCRHSVFIRVSHQIWHIVQRKRVICHGLSLSSYVVSCHKQSLSPSTLPLHSRTSFVPALSGKHRISAGHL